MHGFLAVDGRFVTCPGPCQKRDVAEQILIDQLLRGPSTNYYNNKANRMYIPVLTSWRFNDYRIFSPETPGQLVYM